MQIDDVFRRFLGVMGSDSKLVYLHHHFFNWNGHHMPPVTRTSWIPLIFITSVMLTETTSLIAKTFPEMTSFTTG